jgi:four helix bundle protein
MRDFRKLKVWEKAHQLTLAVYRATRVFPKEELYGLTAQARRASASIPCNIAEACGRHGAKEFARFLDIAAGSASELEYHLLLARDLGLLAGPEHARLAGETRQVKQMLTVLLQRVRSPDRTRPNADS